MVSLVESNLWESFRRAIKTKLHGESFETWFNPIRFEGIDEAQRMIRLRAPNPVVRDWVKSHYSNLIDQSLGELSLAGYSVDWVIVRRCSANRSRFTGTLRKTVPLGMLAFLSKLSKPR